MAIIGFNLSKVAVERKDVISGQIKVNSKMDITNIRKEKIEITKGKEVLRFDFEFLIFYDPELAKLEFRGHVLVLDDPKVTNNILKDWKTKKIENSLKEQVFNLILRKCTVKAFALEEELNLPTHFPLPVVKAEEKK